MSLSPSSWIDDLRAMRSRPIAERLRYLHALRPDRSLTADGIAAAIGTDEDNVTAQWVCDGLAFLIPADHLVDILDSFPRDPDYFVLRESLFEATLPKLVGPALTRLDHQPESALRHLLRAWEQLDARPAISAAGPRFAALASHPDRVTAERAARLAMRSGCVTSEVLDTVAQSLDKALDADRSSYDEELGVSELLHEIGQAGPALAPLAEHLAAHVLGDGSAMWSYDAACAAMGVAAESLAPVLELSYRSRPRPQIGESDCHGFAAVAFATWVFGAPVERFVEARAVIGDGMMMRGFLERAFDFAPSTQRVVSGMCRLANDDPTWRRAVLEWLASIGPSVAQTVRAIATPSPDSDAFDAYLRACYRTGLTGPDATRRNRTSLVRAGTCTWRSARTTMSCARSSCRSRPAAPARCCQR